jgi:hypothetical protein
MAANRRPSLAEAEHGLLRRMWSHRLFRRMLARQGIDPVKARCGGTENMLYRALHTCSHCGKKELCSAWLAGSEPPATYVRFCPIPRRSKRCALANREATCRFRWRADQARAIQPPPSTREPS